MKDFTQVTNLPQKVLAGGLFVGLVIFIKMFLPFIIVAAGVLVAMVFYKQVWDMLNQLAWGATKWMIGNNKIYYLQKGFEYLQNELTEFKEAVVEVGASKIKSERKLASLIQENDKVIRLHEISSDEGYKRELEAKISISKSQIDTISPQLEMVTSKYAIMQEIEKMRETDLNIFKARLDSKIEEYEMLKDLNDASNKANKFLGDDGGHQKKVFAESLKQLENSVSSYMSNIETTNSRMLPKLNGFSANVAYNEENGRAIIEEYKKSRLQIENDK